MTSLTNLSSGIIPSSSAGGLPQPPDTPIIQQRPFSFQSRVQCRHPASLQFRGRCRYAPLSPEERKIKMDNKLCLYSNQVMSWQTAVAPPSQSKAQLPSAMSQKHEAPSLIQPPALEPSQGLSIRSTTPKLFRLQRFQPLRLIDSRHSGGSQANQEVQESVRFHCLKCPSTASLGGSQSPTLT